MRGFTDHGHRHPNSRDDSEASMETNNTNSNMNNGEETRVDAARLKLYPKQSARVSFEGCDDPRFCCGDDNHG